MSRMELLIVDDDRIISLLHHRFVIKSGLHPSPRLFYNGKDALNHIRNHRDERFLVLLDINMPGVSGWDFLDHLFREELTARVRVVMVTSSVDSADMQRARTYDIVIEYIDKPLTFQKLEDLQKLPALKEFQ
jgi:response regulator of citrate/malate metabolism